MLDNVAIAPEAQGSGLGRLLLEFAERATVEAGYAAIQIYTNEVMIENIPLHRRIVYTKMYRVEEMGLRRVYMCKSLELT